MFISYLRLLLFTFGLLAGIQVPGLVKDYSQRTEAHLFESRQALDGFKQTAERFFNGDLQALVRHYRASDDPVFLSDANSIESLLIRNQRLEDEWQAAGVVAEPHLACAGTARPATARRDAQRLQLPDSAGTRGDWLGYRCWLLAGLRG